MYIVHTFQCNHLEIIAPVKESLKKFTVAAIIIMTACFFLQMLVAGWLPKGLIGQTSEVTQTKLNCLTSAYAVNWI